MSKASRKKETKRQARPQARREATNAGRRRTAWIVAVLIVALTWIVYLPSLSNGFVNWDDPESVLENRFIRSINAQSLKWMLTTFHTGNWIPLTWFTHALNYRLGGLDPRMHHMANLILHSLNTALVFFLFLQILTLARSTGRLEPTATRPTQDLATAAFGALLLGIHPIHVESVA